MSCATLFSLAAGVALVTASAPAFDLSPGKPFPLIPLPTTAGGALQSVGDFGGEKLVLHLFASW